MRPRSGDLAISNVCTAQEFHHNILYGSNRQRLVRDIADFEKRRVRQADSDVSCIFNRICGIERAGDEE